MYTHAYEGIEWISRRPPNVCLQCPFQVLTDAVAHGLPVWQHQSGKSPGVPKRFSRVPEGVDLPLKNMGMDRETDSTNGHQWKFIYTK